MPYWHITLASRGRVTLFPKESDLRVAVGKLAGVSRDQALLFAIVDDHLHDLVEAATLAAANQLSRRIQLSLGSVGSAPFFGRDVAPVESRSHLRALVRYILTQPARHGLPGHPALWSGSCFLDLAGARWFPVLKLRLKEALPRLRWKELLEILELPADPLQPVTDSCLRTLGIDRIARAAAAAINVPPEMRGSDRAMVLARRCAVTLARRGGFGRGDLQRQLGWAARSLSRYAAGPAPEGALLAVRRRLALEELVVRGAPQRIQPADRPSSIPDQSSRFLS